MGSDFNVAQYRSDQAYMAETKDARSSFLLFGAFFLLAVSAAGLTGYNHLQGKSKTVIADLNITEHEQADLLENYNSSNVAQRTMIGLGPFKDGEIRAAKIEKNMADAFGISSEPVAKDVLAFINVNNGASDRDQINRYERAVHALGKCNNDTYSVRKQFIESNAHRKKIIGDRLSAKRKAQAAVKAQQAAAAKARVNARTANLNSQSDALKYVASGDHARNLEDITSMMPNMGALSGFGNNEYFGRISKKECQTIKSNAQRGVYSIR